MSSKPEYVAYLMDTETKEVLYVVASASRRLTRRMIYQGKRSFVDLGTRVTVRYEQH